MKNVIITGFITLLLLSGCWYDEERADAYGNFEAREITISSEVGGIIVRQDLDKGDFVKSGDFIAQIDSVQLFLNCEKLKAQLIVMDDQKLVTSAKLQQILENEITIAKEVKRYQNLVASNAVASQILDKVEGELRSVKQQIISLQAQLNGVDHEKDVALIQLEMAKDKLKRCTIISPGTGIIMEKYSEPGELAGAGKSLYKIADVSDMDLRCYISGKQISKLKLNQIVQVQIDNGEGGFHNYEGEVSWISSTAEFTPKIIQTKEERVNLVYAIIVKVQNDGWIKIGMPAEVNF